MQIVSPHDGVESSVVLVSPAYAAKVLDEQRRLGHINRRITQTRVEYYAQQMSGGLWRMNGEPIIFAGSRLLNGQHRLAAVVLANVSVWMMIVSGVSGDVFPTLDSGGKRLASDSLSIDGHTNVVVASAACNLILQYQHLGVLGGSNAKRSSSSEIVAFANLHRQALSDAVTLVQPCYTVLGTPSLSAAVAFLVRAHPKRTSFFVSIAEGIGLTATDPVHLLRERMISNFGNNVSRVKLIVKAAWLVKAWNAYAAERPMSLLRWNQDKEDFPVIVGSAERSSRVAS